MVLLCNNPPPQPLLHSWGLVLPIQVPQGQKSPTWLCDVHLDTGTSSGPAPTQQTSARRAVICPPQTQGSMEQRDRMISWDKTQCAVTLQGWMSQPGQAAPTLCPGPGSRPGPALACRAVLALQQPPWRTHLLQELLCLFFWPRTASEPSHCPAHCSSSPRAAAQQGPSLPLTGKMHPVFRQAQGPLQQLLSRSFSFLHLP